MLLPLPQPMAWAGPRSLPRRASIVDPVVNQCPPWHPGPLSSSPFRSPDSQSPLACSPENQGQPGWVTPGPLENRPRRPDLRAPCNQGSVASRPNDQKPKVLQGKDPAGQRAKFRLMLQQNCWFCMGRPQKKLPETANLLALFFKPSLRIHLFFPHLVRDPSTSEVCLVQFGLMMQKGLLRLRLRLCRWWSGSGRQMAGSPWAP